MKINGRKVAKYLQKSGYDAWFNESDDYTVEDDEIEISGSAYHIQICVEGNYAIVTKIHDDGSFTMTQPFESTCALLAHMEKEGFSFVR